MTIDVRLLDPVADAGAWSGVLAKLRHDFYHLPGYLSMSTGAGERAVGIELREGTSVLFLPLVIRMVPGSRLSDASSPYGYPGPIVRVERQEDLAGFVERAALRLVEVLRQLDLVTCFVRLHPVLTDAAEAFQRVGFLQLHGETVSVDLRQDMHAIWGGIRSGHRNEINRARRQGQQAYVDKEWHHFEDFYQVYNETMRRVGAGEGYIFPRDYYERLRQALGERLHLVVVKIEGDVAAAGLFAETSKVVEYHLSGSKTQFLAQRPTKTMLADVIQWAKDRENTDLHLGGGVGAQRDSLFAFKAGFSKRRHPFYTCRIVVDRDEYGRLVRQHGRAVPDVDDLSGFFPAYRQE